MSQLSDSKLKISQLQAFVSVANHGNFSAAALELGLSQSTISHAIATLEETLGIVLFMRGRHGATLTPEGEQVVQDAQQVLQLLDTIQHKANVAKGLQGGQIRLASVRSITTHVLPKVIVQFRRKFPMMSVVLTEYDLYAEVEQALREGRVDVGFTCLPSPPGFEARALFQDEYVALLPPDSIAPDAPLTWEQLMSHPMIMNVRSARHNQMIYDHCAQAGQALKIGYEVREDSTIVGMVSQGLGASIMARLVAEPIPDGVQVRSLPDPLERRIGVVVLADGLLPRAVFAFLDVLRDLWPSMEAETLPVA